MYTDRGVNSVIGTVCLFNVLLSVRYSFIVGNYGFMKQVQGNFKIIIIITNTAIQLMYMIKQISNIKYVYVIRILLTESHNVNL